MTDAELALATRLAEAEAKLARIEQRLDHGPIKGWARAAEELGVSVDTLARRRREHGDTSRPWWSSRDALLEWFAELSIPVAAPAPRARHALKPPTSAAERRERMRLKYG